MRSHRSRTYVLGDVLLHLVAILGAFVTILPFIWMLFASFKDNTQIFSFPPQILPTTWDFGGYSRLFSQRPFGAWYANSLLIASIVTIAVLFFSSIAGFTFAKYDFRGRRVLFVILLASTMIPFQLILIPLFILISRLGWVDSYMALIGPFVAPALGIFLMRQFASEIPDDLIHAARIDGAGDFRIYWMVALPLLRPGLATLGILTFLGSWNSFLWPLVVLRDQAKMTLPVGLALLQSQAAGTGTDYSVIMAAATMVAVPAIVVFFLLQRQFISGLLSGAVK